MLASLEVSTRVSSAALLDLVTGEEIAEVSLPSEWESSITLLPALEALLQQKGLSPADLAGVAVSVGPGSFTGIRVGLATAAGLCLPSDLLAFGISTLDGLAENLRESGCHGEALCLIDAQRGECYVGHYEIGADSFTEINPPQILGIAKLPQLLRERAWISGPGALRHEKEIHENLGTLGMFAFTALHTPRAMSVARIAYREWLAGRRPSLDELKPLYLRIPSVDEK